MIRLKIVIIATNTILFVSTGSVFVASTSVSIVVAFVVVFVVTAFESAEVITIAIFARAFIIVSVNAVSAFAFAVTFAVAFTKEISKREP